MSEITFDTGEIPECVDCQIKHITDFLHHVNPRVEKEKYKLASQLKEMVREELGMSKGRFVDYDEIRKVEHKIEDYLTVLRDMRHKVEEATEPNPKPKEKLGRLMDRCLIKKESVKPKTYFDPKSFRTLCPECPEQRCAYCPPEKECATRVIIGCEKGEFVKGKCRVGTEVHTIYHGRPK